MMNRSLVALVSLAAIGAFAAELAFQDKKLSEWIDRLQSNSSSALHALTEIGTPAHVAVPAVLRVMPEGEDAGFFSYFRIMSASAVPALERELQSPERAVRRNAARALGQTLIQDKDLVALKVLGAALEHGDADVRKYAARSLAFSTRAVEYAPALRKLLASADIDERLAAATTLIATLPTENEETIAAIQADFPSGSPLFRQELLSTFVRSDLCKHAPTALPFLSVALKDPHYAYEALYGFGKLGPLARAAVLEIEPHLKSESLTYRYAAVSALQAIRQDLPDL